MSGDLKIVLKRPSRGLAALSLLAFTHLAHAQGYADATKVFVDQLSYRSSQQMAQVSSIVTEGDRITDAGDQKIIEGYYNQIRHHYVADPASRIIASADVERSLDTYVNDIEGLFRFSSVDLSKAEKTAEKSGDTSLYAELKFKECVSNSVNVPNLQSKKEQVRTSLAGLRRSLDTPYMFRAMAYSAESRWEGRTSLIDGLGAFNRDLADVVGRCCRQAELDAGKCDSYRAQALDIQGRLAAKFANIDYPPMQYTPNPLDVPDLSGQDLAEIISQRRSVLNTVRTRGTEEYADEQDVFESMARCRIRAKHFQDTRKPLSHSAAFAAAKAVKCSIFPAYAAQNMETQWAKLSVAGVATPIEGNGWDLNCSPNEAEAWNAVIDQSRDPSVWGLDQMANPPYIQSLRSIPPISTGLPMPNITADEYLMLTPTPGLDTFSVGANLNRTSARPTNATGGPRLGNRSGSAIFQNKVVRSVAGVEKGQQLVSSVRQSSSSIRNNDKPEFYANRLSLGAKNTLGFLQTGVSRSKVLGSSRTESASTDNVRRMVLRATGTRASRTTGEGILGSLNGSGSKSNGRRGVITDVGAQNEAVRAQVKQAVEKYLGHIEYARSKGEEARLEAMRLAAEFDSAYGEMRMEVANQPPKKIQAAIAAFMASSRDLINRGAVKRAEYDAYQATILEQSSALSRLVTFGPMNNEVSIDGSGGRGSSRGNAIPSSSSDDLNGLPEGLDTSGRGATRGAWNSKSPDAWLDKMWSMLSPVSSAWAATRTAAEDFEIFYAKEWKRFVTQYGEYVERLRQADQGNAQEAAKLLAARKKSISLENYAIIDTDTLTSIDMFLSELEGETEFLLEGQRAKQFKFSSETLNKIQEARQFTLKARDAWGEAQIAAFKAQPLTLEEDPRVWWSFLPDILLQ